MKNKNIILCGFMGCGKSTVGTLLARKLGMPFVDLDRYIEKKEKMSVQEIFEKNGEEYFRRAEREAASELSEKKGVIIASGGGTLTFPENVQVLKKTGRIILLDLPVETVILRLRNDTTRPLLKRPDKDAVIRELFEKRLPLYQAAADIAVNADDSPMQVCRYIMDEIC